MWPFKPKPLLDDDAAAWHLENFTWLIEEFSPAAFARTQLILPTAKYFPTNGEKAHDLALVIFDQVKTYCGMAAWDVDLVADANPLAEEAALSLAMVAPQKHAVGTFGVAGNRIQISYVPSLLKQPHRLIATFAHELAHYLLATARSRPPCDEDEMEFLTDLTAVYLGFGVFLANGRFRFEALNDGTLHGWRLGHMGYLPETDLIFALSLFIAAKAADPAPALACLKPHLAAMLKRALRTSAKLLAPEAP